MIMQKQNLQTDLNQTERSCIQHSDESMVLEMGVEMGVENLNQRLS